MAPARSKEASDNDRETPSVRKGVKRVPPSAVPVRPSKKAAEVIADHLRRDIAVGALRDGDTLPSEGELIAHFGVSRPTLRSALRMLESESLLTISRGAQGGPQVRHPDADVTARSVAMLLQLRGTPLSDFFAVRAVIEPAAAALLAQHRPPEGLAALREQIAAEEAAAEADDRDGFVDAAIGFYRAVTEHCGSDLFAVFGSVLQTLLVQATNMLRELVSDVSSRIPTGDIIAAHAELVRLIVEGDSAGAEAHWRRHIGDLADAYPELRTVRFSAY